MSLFVKCEGVGNGSSGHVSGGSGWGWCLLPCGSALLGHCSVSHHCAGSWGRRHWYKWWGNECWCQMGLWGRGHGAWGSRGRGLLKGWRLFMSVLSAGLHFDMMSRRVIAASSASVAQRIADVIQVFPCRRDDEDPYSSVCGDAGACENKHVWTMTNRKLSVSSPYF